ncbi:MAG: protein kinase, partial [Acidobacteria bacterium]|nr:protein kinase [Acidobacteriota bacterium]
MRLKICGIQSGGFSNVYTVINLDEMRPYCLKENRALPGDERKKNERLAVEAEISLRLGRSPNLVTTYAALSYKSRLLILTEYLSATSLDLRLKKGSLSLKMALSFGVQLAGALLSAQKILPGFVHGDIKPGNCFTTSKGTLKLGDFGLASADGIRFRDPNPKNEYSVGSSDTSIGWGGTAGYMAPEMFDKTKPDRSNADIYAFGVTLFEMLCGTRPFTAASKEEIIEMHRHSEPPMHLLALKGVPQPVMDLVERCLSKSLAERSSNFEWVENTLRQTLRDQFDFSVPIDPIPELNDKEIVRRAISFAGLGNSQEAVECLDNAIRLRGRTAEMIASKAVALTLGARTDAAYEASTSALMTHADSFVVFLAHSRVLIAGGDLDNAEEYLLKALLVQPNNCVALNLIGRLCLQTKQYGEAARYFNRSRILDATQTETWEGIAITNLAEGRIEKAITSFQKAISLDPRRSELHKLLGDAYRANNQPVEAIKSYKTSLKLAPLSKGTDRRLVRSFIGLYQRNGHSVNVRLARMLIRGTRIFTNNFGTSSDDFVIHFITVLRESNFNPLLLFFFDSSLAEVADGLNARVSQKLAEMLRIVFERCSSTVVPAYVLDSLGQILY